MKQKILSVLGLLVLIFLCVSGLFEQITSIFVWLFTLKYSAPSISLFGQVLVRIGTWISSYLMVGFLFKTFGWFNSKAMKIAYLIISTFVSFVLSWLVMISENYLWIIAITVGCFLAINLILFVALLIVNRKEKEEEVSNNA